MNVRRLVLIIVVIALAALLIDGGVWIVAFFSSISNGLTIHVEAAQPMFDAPGTARFDYDVLGPFMCRVRCEATIVRHDTNETILHENASVRQGGTISVDIAERSTLDRAPIQLVISCSTKPTRYCSNSTANAAIVEVARFSLNGTDTAARAALIANRTRIETSIATNLATIDALRNLSSPYDTIAAQARGEFAGYTRAVSEYERQIRSGAYDAEVPAPPVAITTWNTERDAARNLSSLGENVRSRLERMSRYQDLLGTDTPGFKALLESYRELNGTATHERSVLENASGQLDRLETHRSDAIETATWTFAQNVHERLVSACRIYKSACPTSIEEPTTIETATQLSRTTCTLAGSYDIQALRRSYARTLNLTLEQAEATYNASAIRNQSGFAAFERSAIENATHGNVNLTSGERLAIDVMMPNETATRCSEASLRPFDATLPDPTIENATVTLALPSAHTCAFGDCSPTNKPPVLLIHGHSFAKGSDPTANLQTMTKLALALEGDGYLYAGHLFPGASENLSLDVPTSFTASYYTNSYEENGRMTLATFKSESIESYALRLREDIDEALAITNRTKVVLVAHSMGGLVARSYLDIFGSSKVERLILIGTPNHGITDRSEQLCPLLGAGLECRDMNAGSVFLTKLNAAPRPKIPIRVIAGTGCSGGDGIVSLESALLVQANTTIITGNCSGLRTLHSTLIDPKVHPEVVRTIETDIAASAR